MKLTFQQTVSLNAEDVAGALATFLAEDAPEGDVTTTSVVDGEIAVHAEFRAQEDLVFAGAIVLEYGLPPGGTWRLLAADGQVVKAGEVVALYAGNAREILIRERVLLNLIQRLSGIATVTRAYVAAVHPYKVKILDTRKTTPGLRKFEKYAVAVGGGYNHRYSLSHGILIKDNHLRVTGDIGSATKSLREQHPGMPVELEIDRFEQLQGGLSAGVDGFLLDNMTPDEVRQCVDHIRSSSGGNDIFIEASGGIRLENVREYGSTGVDGISVGALTHSARSVDISMELKT